MVIGVSGVARSGKDTFFKLLKSELKDINGLRIERLAFADRIKKELSEILLSNFNIDIFNPTESEKQKIRPLLVSYGTHLARSIDEDHWIKILSPKIKSNEFNNIISVITDVRYPNEQNFIKSNFKNSCNVHINRFGFEAANEEEAKQTPVLESQSDYIINWDSFNDNESIGLPFIQGFINEKLASIKINKRN